MIDRMSTKGPPFFNFAWSTKKQSLEFQLKLYIISKWYSIFFSLKSVLRESEHGVNSPFTKPLNFCVMSSSNFYACLSCFSFVQSLLPWIWALFNSGKRIFKWWPHKRDWSDSSVSDSERWRAQKWTESQSWSREGDFRVFSWQTQANMCPEVAGRSSGKAIYLILVYHCFIVSHLDSAFLQYKLSRKGCSKKSQFHCIVK